MRILEFTQIQSFMANILGTEGPDSLVGTDELDSLFGLGGGDTLEGSRDGGDTLIGGLESDFLFTFGDNNWLFAGKGDDILRGGAAVQAEPIQCLVISEMMCYREGMAMI
jgi:Ca2+-binding RTX toxin-like protein